MPYPSTPLDGPLSLAPLLSSLDALSSPSHRTCVAPTSILRRPTEAGAPSPALNSPRHAHLFTAGSPSARRDENVDSYFSLGSSANSRTPLNTPALIEGACERSTDFVQHLALLCGRPSPLSPRGKQVSSLSKKRAPGLRISDLPPTVFPRSSLLAPSFAMGSMTRGASDASSCGTADSDETVTTSSSGASGRLMNAGATPGGETEEKKFFDNIWTTDDDESEEEEEEVVVAIQVGSFSPLLGGDVGRPSVKRGASFVVHSISWADEGDE